MTKVLFLTQLHAALKWNLKPKEISNILFDYEGFFDKAVSGGQSEEQTCAELGTPKTIAEDIVAELGRPGILRSKSKWKLALCALSIAVAV
jgi:uncharacterized membrane protein